MKLTLDEFKNTILPALKAAHKTPTALNKAISAFIDGNEIVDADGTPIKIATIDMGTSSSDQTQEETAPAKSADELKADIAVAVKEALAAVQPKPQPPAVPDTETKVVTIPATVYRPGRTDHLEGLKSLPTAKARDEYAYKMGQWTLATGGKNQRAEKFCKEHGLELKAGSEGINTAGGFAVPSEFLPTMIELVERYGTFRLNCGTVPMGRDTMDVPRHVSDAIAYAVGEGVAITESDVAGDQVKLTARKWAALVRFSSELAEDAAINWGDYVTGSIARAFATAEDQCGWNGDGSATFHNIQGFLVKIRALSATFANIAGMHVMAAAGGYAACTAADLALLMGRLPAYAYIGGNVKFYCSQQFWGQVMLRLALAAGGVTIAEYTGGMPQARYLGFPVVITQVFPQATAVNQCCLAFGDLSQAAKFGDRRQFTVKLLEELFAATDQLAIRATARWDINVHDVGNQSATAALRVPGPLVVLQTNAA